MNAPQDNNRPLFVSEKESPLFSRLFYWYVLTLYRRRFGAVWLDDRQLSHNTRATLYIGNHNTWWDALNPLLLSERVIGKRARAMMDEKQLQRYPFFRRLGVFSICRRQPRKALASLDHAARLLNESGYEQKTHPPEADTGDNQGFRSLHNLPRSERPVVFWFYPEGKLVHPGTPVVVESGVLKLARKLDAARTEIVPFATHIHSMRGDKPELFIRIGPAIDREIVEMRSEPAGDRENSRRIAQIIEQLRDTVLRDSARFAGSSKTHADTVDAYPARSDAKSRSLSAETPDCREKHGVDGFRLLLGRAYEK